jgi:hypothetical protein
MLLPEHKNGKTIYRCSCCNRLYDEVPLYFSQAEPYDYWLIPSNERLNRIQLTDELCAIDFTSFFHKVQIAIPIIDFDKSLIFEVWATLSEDNFNKRRKLWNNPKRNNSKPYFGLLRSAIPCYPNTLDVEVKAFEEELGLLPGIEIAEHIHPLTIDQTNGITFKRAIDLASAMLKHEHNSESIIG